MRSLAALFFRSTVFALAPYAPDSPAMALADSAPATVQASAADAEILVAFLPENFSPRLAPADAEIDFNLRYQPAGDAMARSDADLRDGDYLFPNQGRVMLTALSGIPYVGITEIAYGFSDRFAVGVWVGIIPPNIPGLGLRARYVLAQPATNFRVLVKLPLIYYPQTQGFAPWYLAWPTLNAEWRRESGTRWWTGAGLVGTIGGRAIPPPPTQKTQTRTYGRSSSYVPAATTTASYRREGIHNGSWNTVQFGFSKPISRRVAFQLEAAVVLDGVKLASSAWVGGPPVILTTGVSYSR